MGQHLHLGTNAIEVWYLMYAPILDNCLEIGILEANLWCMEFSFIVSKIIPNSFLYGILTCINVPPQEANHIPMPLSQSLIQVMH